MNVNAKKVLIKVHIHENGLYKHELFSWIPIYYTFHDIKCVIRKKLILRDRDNDVLHVYMNEVELAQELLSVKVRDYFNPLPRSIVFDCHITSCIKPWYISFYENWIQYYICKRK